MLEVKYKYFSEMRDSYNSFLKAWDLVKSNRERIESLSRRNPNPSNAEIETEFNQSKEHADKLIKQATNEVNEYVTSNKQEIRNSEKKIEDAKKRLAKYNIVYKHRILTYVLGFIVVGIIGAVSNVIGLILTIILFYMIISSGSKVKREQKIIQENETLISTAKNNINDKEEYLKKRIEEINKDIMTPEKIRQRNDKINEMIQAFDRELNLDVEKGNKYIEEYNNSLELFGKDNIIPSKYWGVLDQIIDYLKNGEATSWTSATQLILNQTNTNKLVFAMHKGFENTASQIQTVRQEIMNQLGTTQAQLSGLQQNLNNAATLINETQTAVEKKVNENGKKITRIKNVVAPNRKPL